MKKSINKLNLTLLFMFISLLFFAPVKVEAVSYKSDFVNLEDTVEFSTDKFIIDLKYTEFDNGN